MPARREPGAERPAQSPAHACALQRLRARFGECICHSFFRVIIRRCALSAAARRRGFTHVLAPSSSFGRDVLPRAAALLDAQPASDVVALVDAETVVRPFYAGNVLQTVRFAADGPRMLTARPGRVAPEQGRVTVAAAAALPCVPPVAGVLAAQGRAKPQSVLRFPCRWAS